MKILMLNASPRVNGNISKMLHIIAQECEANGAEVELIRVQDLKVHPCMACMKCRSSLQCVLPADDAQRILALMAQSDALVVGAPCYWGNMPGTLKMLFDRMVYGMMGENSLAIPQPLHKGKRCVIVTASSTMWPFNILANQTRGVVRALKEILGWSGLKCVATIQKAGTLRHPEFTESDRKKCLRAARRLYK
ncbi:MAG: flavodoxin family protein [Sodaliphilus sp.]